MPCTCCGKSEQSLQAFDLSCNVPYPIRAQLNGVTLVRCTKCGMCDASADFAFIFQYQEVGHGVVRQALLQDVSLSAR